MRVLLLSGYYPPPYNAAGLRALHLVRLLRARGFDVLVVPLIGGGRSFWGEKVVPLQRPRRGLKRYAKLVIRFIKLDSKLKSVIKEFRPDIIVATLPPVEAPFIGKELSREFHALFVVDVQDLVDDHRLRSRNRLLKPILYMLFKSLNRIISESDLIITVTEPLSELIGKRTGRKDIVVAYNGVDASSYRKCFEKHLDLIAEGTSRLAIVYMGDLNSDYHWFELETMIRAFKIAAREVNKKFELHLIGDGRLVPKVLKLASSLQVSNSVKHLGYISHEKLGDTLHRYLVGVAGGPREPYPWFMCALRVTILEYIACGLPVTAFGAAGSYTQRFIEDKSIGIYAAPGEVEDVAAALIKSIEIGQDKDIVRRARIVAEERDWTRVLRPFVNALENLT